MRKNLVFIFITFICLDLFSQGASNNNYDLISKLFFGTPPFDSTDIVSPPIGYDDYLCTGYSDFTIGNNNPNDGNLTNSVYYKSVMRGETYHLNLEGSYCGGALPPTENGRAYKVYIDYNGNEFFDDHELVYSSEKINFPIPIFNSALIKIPNNAKLGETKMRIIYANVPNSIWYFWDDLCGVWDYVWDGSNLNTINLASDDFSQFWGETEDYSIIVEQPDSGCQLNSFNFSLTTDNYGYETSFELYNSDGTNIYSVTESSLQSNNSYNYDFCLEDGCYELVIYDSYGDGFENDCSFFLTNEASNVIFQTIAFNNVINYDFCTTQNGCIDQNACNFDESAVLDDGSCIYQDSITNCFGNCFNDIDSDGICDENENTGCTDSNSYNFNQYVNIDDGSCQLCVDSLNGETVGLINIYLKTDSYPNELYLKIEDENDSLIWYQGNEFLLWCNGCDTQNGQSAYNQDLTDPLEFNSIYNWQVYLDEIGCYKFIIRDFYGDGLNSSDFGGIDGNWSVSNSQGIIIGQMDNVDFYLNEINFYNFNVFYGCTDTEANNYNPEATEEDGSCEYPVVYNPCDITPSELFVDNIIHDRVSFNWSAPSSAPSYYMIRYRPVGTSSWTVMSAGSQNDMPFTGTTRTRYFMEPSTTYQWNIRARVVNENGTTVCQSPWSASHQFTTLPACANLSDLSVNPEANLVYFNASIPSGEWGIWQAKGKIREVGSNNYRYLATTEDNYTNQIKYNFTPSTDYEWHTKAWCTGNLDEDDNSDPQYHSGWGEFSAFTTQDPCDKLPTNLSTSSGNNANTAITMGWDTPASGQPHHYFLELTNETTGQVFSWNNLAASSMSKTKYGQSSGDQFKWRIRGACGENGTSWATQFTYFMYYTLGGDRLGNDSQSISQLTNTSVYPNPSRGEFNISFDIENRQDVYLSITNYLGEVIFTEELKDQEGLYSKSIDLGNKANGIYMLNITTNNQNINQKIIVQ